VDEICRPAGVHQGSFSQCFPSKQGLVLAVLAMSGQPIRDLWKAGRLPLAGALPASVCMVRAARAADSWMGAPLGNLALELGSQDPVMRQKLHAMFTAWACGIERGWREAMASGALPTLDPGTTAQTVVAYFEGVMMWAKTQNTPELITRLAHGAVALVEAAAGAAL